MVIAWLMLLAPCTGALAGSQISPMFTYQGVLQSNGAPYSGTADLRFTLFDAAVGGNAVGSPIAVNAVQVTGGLFTADLYVDTPAINGDERWLAIEVCTPSSGGAGPYTALSGRQHLAPVPHAMFAANALHVSGEQNGAVWFNNATNAFTGSSLAIDGNTLRVDPVSHRVGIGTDAPKASLHIAAGGSGIAQPDPDSTLVLENYFTNYLSMLTSAGYPSGILFGHAGAANQQATAGIIFNSPNAENGLDFRTGGNQSRMVIKNSGNVGIGTPAPATPLEVSGDSGPALLQLSNPQVGAAAMRFSQPSHSWLVGQNNSLLSGLDFSIYDETSDRYPFVIDNLTGNVGINTTSPTDVLSVRGSSTAISAYDGYVTTRLFSSFQNAKGYVGTSTPNGFVIRTWDQDRMIIDANGNVGIGTLYPTQLFSVNGTAGKPGGGSWSTFSDARLKTNVHDLHGALDSLLSLRGVTFEYTNPAAINERPGEHIGMIAQEVEQVFPQWVSQSSPDGYRQLAFSGFEALTVEALRDLRSEKDAEITELRARVAHLESLIQSMLNKEKLE